MRIHCLQHVPFEDSANVGTWAKLRGHPTARTLLYENQPLPALDEFDWLVILGGLMNVYQDREYPWLAGEKRFLREVIDADKTVLGICLGAQLLSVVLGGEVTPNPRREVGWYDVTLTDAAAASPIFADLPRTHTAFHWHSDTFTIPPGAVHVARSEACDSQAFQFGRRVVGLQFHWDYWPESVVKMIDNCGDELDGTRHVQTPEEMLSNPERFDRTTELLFTLLDAMAKQ